MATRCSWLILVVVFICAIHFNSLDVDAFSKNNKGDDCCCPTYDCCDSGGGCDDCGSGGGGGGKKKYKQIKRTKYYDDDDCDCCDSSDCCSGDGNKKGFKEDLKDKIFRKFTEKRERKEQKRKEKERKKKKNQKSRTYEEDCCDDGKGDDDSCDSCQTIVVENGPAIIQTVIVDKDLYARYGVSCFESPLQKVVVQDDESCYIVPSNSNNYCNPCSITTNPCQKECEPQNLPVVVKDPYYRSQYYPGYGYT